LKIIRKSVKMRDIIHEDNDSLIIPLTFFTAFVGRMVFVLLGNFLETTKRYTLENDPMCGLTTGGSEDCFWKCETEERGIITNPECLSECFPKV